MKPSFNVRVIRFDILEELDGVWIAADFLALLETMEYGDTSGISPAELREMCLLSLQDLQPNEAAALLLQHKLGTRLRSGEISNISYEMLDDKLWEEHADMALHEAMFNIGSLLYSAFPQIFPEPDAVRVRLVITAINELAQSELTGTLSESFVLRLLADGMDNSAVLHRIFGQQIGGQAFPEADLIVWTICQEQTGEDTIEIEIISSGYWLDSLRDTVAYESRAYADAAK